MSIANLRYGSAIEVANELDSASNDQLRAALINALRRIDTLERQMVASIKFDRESSESMNSMPEPRA